MIYTTYLSKIKDIPDNAIKILIMKFKPKWINNYKDIIWFKSLAPRLFDEYKFNSDISKEKLFNDYYDYLKNDDVPCESILKIINLIENGKDVCFICCEKDPNECHRKILAEYISKKTNIEWKEL